jgi:membrane fusion protein (multidrug efflux system)
MELARAEFDRAQSLTASKVMSTADLDQKKAQYAVAVARWEKAKTLRDYTVIRAPFAGIVTEKYARIGQKVIEDKGEPLFKITAVEPLLARVYLPEEELLNVKLGERVDVVAERFPDAKTTGEVQFISPAVDPASGTFQVVVRVRREAARSVLRPGIAVKIRFTRAAAR